MTQVELFTHVRGLILKLAKLIGGKKYGNTLEDLYVKFWNPINYALIGGFGVFINYAVWLLLMRFNLPWFMVNGAAIFTAWTWNWVNSVGPLGWVWGFEKRKTN